MSDVLLKLLVLKTADLPRLRAFYEVLGLHFREEQHGTGPLHFSAPIDGMVLELYPLASGAAADSSTRLGFAVVNLHATIVTLEGGGTKITTPPKQGPWGNRAVVKDPDGRAVELYQN